jgi:VanZ family protein
VTPLSVPRNQPGPDAVLPARRALRYWTQWAFLGNLGVATVIALYRGRRAHLVVALDMASLGAALEYLQLLTGYRVFSYADILANLAGAILGLSLAQTRLGETLSFVERHLPHR